MSNIYFTPTSFADALKAAAITQTAWGLTLKNLLGNTRQLVGLRNGVEFYRCALTGAMEVVGGKIVKFGSSSNVTKNLAVNLGTGNCELRIEGNGNVVHASLGLTDSGKDYTLDFNPDGVSPLAFSPTATLSPYGLLPTGVGPAAPMRTESMVHRIKLWDWTNQASPALVSAAELDKMMPYWPLQDLEMAQVYGDWLRPHTTTPIEWGPYRISAKMTISDASHGESGTAPLQTLRTRWAYDWDGFPESTNYDKQNMLLNPPPFKVTLHDFHDNLIFTHEWPGGKPINDPAFPQSTLGSGGNVVSGQSPTMPLYPRFDIGQVLIWKSERSAVNPLASKFFTGVRNYRPSMAKSRLACNPVVPAITGGYSGNGANGLAHPFYLPKYPQAFVPRTLTDPYLDVVMNNLGASSQYNGWKEGFGYMAGGLGGADVYTSTGGGRGDRGVFETQAILSLMYPGQNRLQDDVPFVEIAHEWLLNSYNYGLHWDVDKASIMANNYTFRGKYYGDAAQKTTKEILLNNNQRDGTYAEHFDASGMMVMGGRGIDSLHDYRQVGKLGMLYLSPDLIEESYYDTAKSFMIHGEGIPRSDYMYRTQAWDWLAYVIAWKCGTSNPEGFSQQEISTRFSSVLNQQYITIDKPTFIDNEQSAFCIGIRNLGTPLDTRPGCFYTTGGRLFFYMSDTLLLFKQTGFWSHMYGKGGNEAFCLGNMLRNMDKYCFDQILDTNGDATAGIGYSAVGDGVNLSSIPASWAADWAARQAAGGPDLVNDFLHMHNPYAPAGQEWGWYSPNTDHSSNTFEAYAYMRDAFFPEFPNPRNAAAKAKFQVYADFVTTRVNAAATPQAKMYEDYPYRFPGLSPKNPPADGLLGPA